MTNMNTCYCTECHRTAQEEHLICLFSNTNMFICELCVRQMVSALSRKHAELDDVPIAELVVSNTEESILNYQQKKYGYST